LGSGSTAHVNLVTNLVLNYHPKTFENFLTQLFALFDSLSNPTDTDTLLPIIQDAWNYFPHRGLDGRCPAKLFLKLHPEGLERLEFGAEQ
jgi:hypothetical protein